MKLLLNEHTSAGTKFRAVVVFFMVLLSVNVMAAGSNNSGADLSKFAFETMGPKGEDPVSYETIFVAPNDARTIKSGGYKAALLMHTSGDWVNAVLAGAQAAFADLNVDVVATADAEFDANKQRTDIETALALDPDIIITLILDPVTGAEALRPAIERGVKVVLLSNLPQGFVHGQDYASIVTDDLFNMGKSVAEMMGDYLGGSGEVALIYHDADYYVTNQRDNSVEAVLTKDFPGINIVARRGLANPADSEVIASALLTEFPNIDAIYATWDGPAEGVVAALRAAGRDDAGVFTMDLGANNVLDMVKGGSVKGVVADLPFELGKAMANIGALAVLGQDTPAFVTVPAIKVTQSNVPTQWKRSLNRDLPAEILNALP